MAEAEIRDGIDDPQSAAVEGALERGHHLRGPPGAQPNQMCDLPSCNTSGDFDSIVAGCMSHSRRKYVEVAENFPDDVDHMVRVCKKESRGQNGSGTERRTMRLVEVKALGGHLVWVRFDDGREGEINLSHLAGQGVFAAWEQPGEFEKVSIGSGGEASWACGVDLCADALYLRLTGKTAQELFPALSAEAEVA